MKHLIKNKKIVSFSAALYSIQINALKSSNLKNPKDVIKDMKQFRKEHVDDIYLGNASFFVPERNPENSFSKSITELDSYPRSKEPIGKLNPVVQAMGIQSSDI